MIAIQREKLEHITHCNLLNGIFELVQIYECMNPFSGPHNVTIPMINLCYQEKGDGALIRKVRLAKIFILGGCVTMTLLKNMILAINLKNSCIRSYALLSTFT